MNHCSKELLNNVLFVTCCMWCGKQVVGLGKEALCVLTTCLVLHSLSLPFLYSLPVHNKQSLPTLNTIPTVGIQLVLQSVKWRGGEGRGEDGEIRREGGDYIASRGHYLYHVQLRVESMLLDVTMLI